MVIAKVADVKQDSDGNGSIATLTVSSGWKKKVPREISVSTHTTCAFNFTTGEEYVLYLFQTPEGGYYTSKCVGDVRLDGAARAVAWLKQHGTTADPN